MPIYLMAAPRTICYNRPNPTFEEAPKMSKYLSCFTYLFKYANWMPTLAMGSLMMLVPIVGPMVVSGWQIELFKARLAGDKENLPVLDFSRFSELMSLGAIPFIAGFLAVLPMLLFFYILLTMAGAAVFLLATLASAALVAALGEIGGIISLIATIALGALLLALTLGAAWVMGAVVQIIVLRAELTRQLGAAFNVQGIRENAAHLLRPLIKGNIVLGLMAGPMMLIGYMMCLVGLYPALFLLVCAGCELRTLVYRDYLDAGHPPIA